MPHLSFEYSRRLGDKADMTALCSALRDTLLQTGLFPVGGIRVRGHACDCESVADGDPAHMFLHMTLRIGEGRSPEDREKVMEQIYQTAERFLKPLVGEATFGLSLELKEIIQKNSIKRWNSIHAALARE